MNWGRVGTRRVKYVEGISAASIYTCEPPVDTPPMDVSIVVAGLLAHSSMLLSRLPDAKFASVALFDSGSLFTVAGAAPALMLIKAFHRIPS